MIGVCSAAQNARRRFGLAAAAPIVENVGVTATLLIFAFAFGTGHEVGTVSSPALAVLAIGSTLAVAAHAALQWWGARRAGITIRPRRGWRDRDVVEMARLAIPSMGSTGLGAARHLALAVAAGTIPGGWVALQIGLHFYQLPVALAGRPVGIALLPRLSRYHLVSDQRGFRHRVSERPPTRWNTRCTSCDCIPRASALDRRRSRVRRRPRRRRWRSSPRSSGRAPGRPRTSGTACRSRSRSTRR